MKLKNIILGAGLMLGSLQASALNIALTNDDGWSTPGIQALFQVLTEAGHTVVLAGPLDGQSGSSGAFNTGGLEITKQAENQYSVALEGGEEGAEPATSGMVAIQIITDLTGQAPDLLVSGINDGANVGPAATISGTVGATIASVSYIFGDSIPGIAISADEHCDEDIPLDSACLEVAEFLSDYIDHLEQRPNYVKGNSALLQREIALNINYPAGTPKGVVVSKQGEQPFLGGAPRSLTLGCSTDCNELAVGESAEGGIIGAISIENFSDIDQADTVDFADGYITVVPLRASYGTNAQGLKGYLKKFDY